MRDTLWTLILSVTIVAVFPLNLAAQGTTFGTGVQSPLKFEGEGAAEDLLSLSFGVSAFYDDNVLATDADRISDEAVSFDSHLGVSRQTENLKLSFDYMPFFLLYRQFNQFDRLNHAASVSVNYRLAPRFILGLHDSFSYQNGLYTSITAQPILSGLSSPTALNQGIYPYTTRTLSDMAGLDLTFEKSRRTSFTLLGGYDDLKYGNQSGAAEKLYNGTGFSGGVRYQYLVTEHTTFALNLTHQDSTYEGGEIFGYQQRSQIESALLSLGLHVSPTVTINAFGGPQYFRILSQSVGAGAHANGLQGAGGGSIVKEVRRTALTFSAQRDVTDGGGLYTSVISSSASFGVRQRLVGRWQGGLRVGATEANTSLFKLANEKTDALTSTIDISRPLQNRSVFHISYANFHQLSKGTLPIGANFDRDQITIGFDYQLKSIPLGR